MPAGTATERYPVRSYELDTRGRLTVSALCNYLQESASLDARDLGVALGALQAEGMTWFLWRLHVEIESGWLPGWGETVVVETWPAQMSRPYAIRDYRIRDGEGHAIGVATSAWLVMSTATGKLVRRVPERIRALHPDPPRRALADDFRRLPPCAEADAVRTLRVRRSDLDLNDHLNHVAAIAAVLEAVPAEAQAASRLAGLEVELKAEGRYGDEMESRCRRQPEDGSTLVHALVRLSDGAELARARTRWRAASDRVE